MFKRGRHVIVLILLFFILSFSVDVNGKHFVLVHGAGHGEWCWYKVATMLKSAGHNVTTIDMAASGINPIQVQEIHSISKYYEPLMTFMESLPPKEKVILVGHSYGGIPLSVAMEKFSKKVSVAVFVTALVMSETLNFTSVIQENERRTQQNPPQLLFFNGPNSPPTALLLGSKLLASHLYQLSPNEDLTLGSSLVRPHPIFNDIKLVLKETRVTKQRNGRVPKVFIISKGDNIIKEDMQLWIIERTGPYVEVKVIKDSDHMVMFSKPKKLTSHILKIAHKY
ncbi:alpha/beta fold hydrolase [Medicago truncatula]|uniref:Alpha/beta fold hydrolase n=1 Tax=Medicago truncatula TaxID=3880 RepID=A0A072TM99_MEDTR|nr:alpha/beta fold hydrolase [Medicago truncatula]